MRAGPNGLIPTIQTNTPNQPPLMNTSLASALGAALFLTVSTGARVRAADPAPAAGCAPAPAPASPAARVQLALLLDTSGSMEGLIHQARSRLWSIVNEFNTSRRDGKTPEVEVALYEYGNDSLNPENHWVRCVTPLTRDLDEVSRQLFALRTNGGSEFCGAVIRHAARNLTWDRSPGVYRAIFIAGNEPFTQGPVDALETCKAVSAEGVFVNTIHCGAPEEGVNTGWKAGALLADGKFLTINQDAVAAHVECPQDKEIVRLGIELNRTYIRYGARGEEKLANQAVQDRNAASAAPAAPVARALAKSSANYHNSGWDLVDAVKTGGVKLAEVKREQLARDLQSLTPEQLREHVEKQAADRAALQARIQTLNTAREKFLAGQTAPAEGAETLDTAVIRAIHEQAGRVKFEWAKP